MVKVDELITSSERSQVWQCYQQQIGFLAISLDVEESLRCRGYFVTVEVIQKTCKTFNIA